METTIIVVIVAALSIIAILARGKLVIDAARAGGRIVLHYPAPGAEPMALLSLTAHSVILDRSSALALKRRIDGAQLDPGDERTLAQLDALAPVDLRVGDEVAGGLPPGKRPGIHLPLRVPQGGPEFTDLVARLRDRGVSDPGVVAEALLAATDEGVTARLITSDAELITRLQRADAASAPASAAAYRPGPPQAAPVRISFEGHAIEVTTITR